MQKSQVHLSCKTTFEDERTKQLIIQNSTTHTDTATKLKVNVSQWREGSLLRTYENRIIGAVVIGLHFVSKQAVTMQPAIAIDPVPKFQPPSKIAKSEIFHLLHAPSA